MSRYYGNSFSHTQLQLNEAKSRLHRVSKANYRGKYLDLRKSIRDFLDGKITEQELAKLAGRR